MKAKLTTYLTFVLIVILSWTTQAVAGGDYYAGAGSVKDYGGTPVPAPIPLPTYDPVWYFRADLGFGLSDDPGGASEKGMVFGERGANQYSAEHTFGPDSGSIKSDYDQQAVGAIGVGFRWNERFRTDVTGEWFRAQKVRILDHSSAALMQNGALVPGGTVVSETDDQTHIKGGVVMFNGYYDMASDWHGFTPYIGAGLGFAIAQIDRKNTNTEVVHDPNAGGSVDLHAKSSHVGNANDVMLAAMATVGTSYRISDITELDFNYRYLYIDGVNAEVAVNGHTSSVETEGTSDHQLRAGVRFNIQ
jgi:opacity protein-like surface antigen